MAGGDLLMDRLVAGGFLRPAVLLRGLQLRRPALSCWRVSLAMGLSGLVVEPLAWLQSWLFARRLQIQENLTQQIAEAVADVTKARGVAVVIDSAHMCMMMRGVGKQESTTRTVSFVGDFKTDKDARREFLSAVPESY